MEITGRTRFGGLLGSPVSHSISPMMHNLSFQTLGIDAVYLCFETKPENLRQTLEVFRNLDTYGFNLTMPLKETVLPLCDSLSEAAALAGAANTVVNEGGRLVGHNTDGAGFLRSLREREVEIQGKNVTILGAGGAGGAIAVQVALEGAGRLHLMNRRSRSFERARKLVDLINGRTACKADLTDLEDEREVRGRIMESDLLINATSVGMGSSGLNDSPLKARDVLLPPLFVADVIYNPRKTKLLCDAERNGCRTANGMYMLLYQGAAAFELWTKTEMPVELVRQRFFEE